MDVFILAIAVLFVSNVDVTYQQTQDGDAPAANITDVPLVISCLTGKSDPGICVKLGRCDYGTKNIDFSLYAPRGYKRPCNETDVCCPSSYIIQEQNSVQEKENFDFD